jgi:peptidoglycan/LPS O-acetylase OafA/YrhL
MLDGLRGLAAVCVVLYSLAFTSTRLLPLPHYGNYLQHAYLAADFFFLLSGFVIAHAYERRLQSDGFGFLDFLRLRLIRLYPIYFAGLVLGTVAVWLTKPWALGPGLFTQQAFFIPNYHPGEYAFRYNMPAWTLMFEVVVSLAYALCRPWLRSWVLLLVIAVSGAMLGWADWSHDTNNFGVGHPDLPLGLLRAIFGFFYGVILYRAYHVGLLPEELPTSALLVFLAFGLLLALPIGGGHNGDFYDIACLLVGFPLIILFSLPITSRSSLFPFLGDFAYPLYAIHFPLLTIIISKMEIDPLATPETLWIVVAALMLTLIGASWALYKLYDEPLRRKLRSWNRRFTPEPDSLDPDSSLGHLNGGAI